MQSNDLSAGYRQQRAPLQVTTHIRQRAQLSTGAVEAQFHHMCAQCKRTRLLADAKPVVQPTRPIQPKNKA